MRENKDYFIFSHIKIPLKKGQVKSENARTTHIK